MIKTWPKIGKLEVLARSFDKVVAVQRYQNPKTLGVQECSLVGHGDWSATIALTIDGMVIVVKEFKRGADRIMIELPGGRINPGETPRKAARRELLEETGYSSPKFIRLGPPMFMSPGSSWARFHSFLGLGCKSITRPKPSKNELVETILLTWEDWLNMCCSGKIVSPSAVIATFFSLPYLGYRIVR